MKDKTPFRKWNRELVSYLHTQEIIKWTFDTKTSRKTTMNSDIYSTSGNFAAHAYKI